MECALSIRLGVFSPLLRLAMVVVVVYGGLWFLVVSNACVWLPLYRREEPSGLRKRWTPGVFNYSSLLLPGQLDDNAAFNNCTGYSRTHC